MRRHVMSSLCMCFKLSQRDKWTLQFLSYSPAFYLKKQNKTKGMKEASKYYTYTCMGDWEIPR